MERTAAPSPRASNHGQLENVGPGLEAISGIEVYNTSPLTLKKILADAIVDRITTNAHATVLTCEDSMRKHFTQLD